MLITRISPKIRVRPLATTKNRAARVSPFRVTVRNWLKSPIAFDSSHPSTRKASAPPSTYGAAARFNGRRIANERNRRGLSAPMIREPTGRFRGCQAKVGGVLQLHGQRSQAALPKWSSGRRRSSVATVHCLLLRSSTSSEPSFSGHLIPNDGSLVSAERGYLHIRAGGVNALIEEPPGGTSGRR